MTWSIAAYLRCGVRAALAVALLGIATFAQGAQRHVFPRHETAFSASKFEIQFLEGMIDHHAMAVHMAQLLHEKAIHPELRSLGDSISVTQSAEITQMQGWLKQWYGRTHEPSMMMSSMQPLQKLNGAAFEKEFLRMMIHHHAMAVKQAGECQHRDKHPELHALCLQIEHSQQAEIATMKRWRCEWYRNCK